MTEEQIKSFLEKVQNDTTLQDKLKTASSTDAVVAIANEAGYEISAADFKKSTYFSLDEIELEGVSGGQDCPLDHTIPWISCVSVPCSCE